MDSTGSVYSAFCRCQDGADQGCRHLGATLCELDDFLSNQGKSVTFMSAYWNPKPTPTHKPVPMSEIEVSKSTLMKRKRIITPCDDSWIDFFHPRPIKGRKEITHIEKIDFAKKLRKIYLCSGILDFLPFSLDYDKNEHFSSHLDNNISHLTILSQAKNYVYFIQILISYQTTTFQILLKNF